MKINLYEITNKQQQLISWKFDQSLSILHTV